LTLPHTMADILLAPAFRPASVSHPAASDAKRLPLNSSILPCQTETYSLPFVQDNKTKIILSKSKSDNSISFQPQAPADHRYDEGDGISRDPAVLLSLSKEDPSFSPKRRFLAAIISHLLTVKNSHRESSITAWKKPGGESPLSIKDGPTRTIISKPPAIPYSTLILEALLQSPRNALSTKGICKHIMENYKWYSVNRHGGWQVNRSCTL
jgi:hypothetical protein